MKSYKKRKNPWSERFWKEILANSKQGEDSKAILEWELKLVLRSDNPSKEDIEVIGDIDKAQLEELVKKIMVGRCICTKDIKYRFLFKNKITNKVVVIGSCCMKRFGVKLRWKSKNDYLISAMYFAKNDSERDFVRELLDKEVKWGGRLKISEGRKKILEKITGKEWSWKCWEKGRFG